MENKSKWVISRLQTLQLQSKRKYVVKGEWCKRRKAAIRSPTWRVTQVTLAACAEAVNAYSECETYEWLDDLLVWLNAKMYYCVILLNKYSFCWWNILLHKMSKKGKVTLRFPKSQSWFFFFSELRGIQLISLKETCKYLHVGGKLELRFLGFCLEKFDANWQIHPAGDWVGLFILSFGTGDKPLRSNSLKIK